MIIIVCDEIEFVKFVYKICNWDLLFNKVFDLVCVFLIVCNYKRESVFGYVNLLVGLIVEWWRLLFILVLFFCSFLCNYFIDVFSLKVGWMFMNKFDLVI